MVASRFQVSAALVKSGCQQTLATNTVPFGLVTLNAVVIMVVARTEVIASITLVKLSDS